MSDTEGQTRTPRETASREKTARKRSWERPNNLPTPEDEMGYTFRWVRMSSLGNPDPKNLGSKFREGWEPVLAKDHPDFYVTDTGMEDSRFKDNIIIGGLILCKIPIEILDERADYYQQQNRAQMESVDNNFMRENDPRMPKFRDRKSEVSFGEGNR